MLPYKQNNQNKPLEQTKNLERGKEKVPRNTKFKLILL